MEGDVPPGKSDATTAGEDAYEVGYCKPPVATRFKKGQSGNPGGRPKKEPSRRRLEPIDRAPFQRMLLEEANRMIVVRDGDRSVEMPAVQAVFRSLTLHAAKGNMRAQKMLVDLLISAEAEGKNLYDRHIEALMQFKIDGEAEIEQYKKRGIEPPPIFPHPDDIHVNLRSGVISVHGPMTEDEKKTFDIVKAHLQQLREEVDRLQKRLSRKPDDKAIKAEIRRKEKLIERFELVNSQVWSPNARLVE